MAEYEQSLREKEHTKESSALQCQHEQELKRQSEEAEKLKWQTIGKFKVCEGITIDTEMGLMWLRFALGQFWKNGAVQGKPKDIFIVPTLRRGNAAFTAPAVRYLRRWNVAGGIPTQSVTAIKLSLKCSGDWD